MSPDDLRLLGLASTSVRMARGWMVDVGEEDVHVDISRIPSDFIACAEGVPKLLALLAKRDGEIERLRAEVEQLRDQAELPGPAFEWQS